MLEYKNELKFGNWSGMSRMFQRWNGGGGCVHRSCLYRKIRAKLTFQPGLLGWCIMMKSGRRKWFIIGVHPLVKGSVKRSGKDECIAPFMCHHELRFRVLIWSWIVTMISILNKFALLERNMSDCCNVIRKQIAHGLGVMRGKPHYSLYCRPKGVTAPM